MVSFEAQLVRCFNEFYLNNNIAAMCYKLPMIKYRQQGFDIYCDSSHYEHYLAMECKSINAEEEEMLYFSRYFHHVKGVHQLQHENLIVEKSGRHAFLAVELRSRRGVRKACYLVPWSIVMLRYLNGIVGISLEEIVKYCELDYNKGDYHITDDVYQNYLSQISSKERISLKQRMIKPKQK